MPNIILSERQKPRVLAALREMYKEHAKECPDGVRCRFAKEMKRQIDGLERELEPQHHAASASA